MRAEACRFEFAGMLLINACAAGEDPQSVVMGLMTSDPDLAELIIGNRDTFKSLLLGAKL